MKNVKYATKSQFYLQKCFGPKSRSHFCLVKCGVLVQLVVFCMVCLPCTLHRPGTNPIFTCRKIRCFRPQQHAFHNPGRSNTKPDRPTLNKTALTLVYFLKTFLRFYVLYAMRLFPMGCTPPWKQKTILLPDLGP